MSLSITILGVIPFGRLAVWRRGIYLGRRCHPPLFDSYCLRVFRGLQLFDFFVDLVFEADQAAEGAVTLVRSARLSQEARVGLGTGPITWPSTPNLGREKGRIYHCGLRGPWHLQQCFGGCARRRALGLFPIGSLEGG